jgi:photosystem II stability/assembly factor-like uncharacterized protein
MTEAMAAAPDGTLWLACAGEPGAGTQRKWVSRSTDGGTTWTAQSDCLTGVVDRVPCVVPGSGYLGSLTALSSEKAFMVGDRSPPYETDDGARTWTSVATPAAAPNGTSDVVFVDPDHGWIIDDTYADGGSLSRTVDGGTTWTTAWPAPT